MLLVKRFVSAMCCISGKFLGNYLMVLYFFVKLAFIANCLSQLFVLNLLLGHEFHKFGFELMDKIWRGKGWDTGSRIFPKTRLVSLFQCGEQCNARVSLAKIYTSIRTNYKCLCIERERTKTK